MAGQYMAATKFDELRTKTERELVYLINSELDLGIEEARQALIADTSNSIYDHYFRARQAYFRVSRLIPLMEEPAEDQPSPEVRLQSLGEVLDGLSTGTAAPKKENIAPLARELWKARGCPDGSPDDDWFKAEKVLKRGKASHAVCC
jgi:Protein of unknown function (DUF2934)